MVGVSDSTKSDREAGRTKGILRVSFWITPVLSVLIFLLNFVALTPPSPYITFLVISVLGWIVLGIAWIAQLLLARRLGLGWNRLGTWFFPALVALIIVLASLEVPFRVTFAASRDAMNRAAHDVRTGRRTPQTIHWIGLYPVEFASGDEWGFWFAVRGTGPFRPGSCECPASSGFVYSWDSKNPDPVTLRHVGGRWYSHPSSCYSCA